MSATILHRVEAYGRLLRRKFSRGRWFTRLLNLSVSEGDPNRAGLIIIQVDGLSHDLAATAMRDGKLGFLGRMAEREDYQLFSQYAGLPSSTPAVQAEIFYGVKTSVPAFAFLNRETHRVERMYEPSTATRVQEEIEAGGAEGLLRDGSSYSNNFTGGASLEESHFCAPSLGWQALRKGFSPITQGLLFLTHLPSVLRVIGLVIVELGLASVDFCRGVYRGHGFLRELKFIPTRVGISVIMREICVLGAKIDMHRGLPVIHMNFLGYDEQAHRRGPRSRFALRSLQGIDYAIKRIWRDAARAERRHYEVWVYSDHGQSSTTTYSEITGYPIHEAVQQAAHYAAGTAAVDVSYSRYSAAEDEATQCLCATSRGPGRTPFEHAGKTSSVEVVSMGPVGFAYFQKPQSIETLLHIAESLVQNHQVPAVVVRCPDTEQLTAISRQAGRVALPEGVEHLCGSDHPFVSYFAEDLHRLCRHQHAGELILLGWCKGNKSVTFARENGSHGGLTPSECTAFSLLPIDAPIDLPSFGGAIRPADLRRAALRKLGRRSPAKQSEPYPFDRASIQAGDTDLRIMTYNTHGCVGTDGKLAPERIAQVIARLQPDVVALQEIDVGRSRSDREHQAERIAEYLQMAYHFHPSFEVEEGAYGNAILSRFPITWVKTGELPRGNGAGRREPRGVMWAGIDVHGTTVQVLNTHLGLSVRERRAQAQWLLSEEGLGQHTSGQPLVLCGDFNALPASWPMRKLRARLKDVQQALPGHRPRATFYSHFPSVRIDYILAEPSMEVSAVHVPRSTLARSASDHLPLVADLKLEATQAPEHE